MKLEVSILELLENKYFNSPMEPEQEDWNYKEWLRDFAEWLDNMKVEAVEGE